jgi:ketosteroid isomerase-like protein
VSTVEERLQRLEDHAAIVAVIAAYGPAVDSGSGPEAAALFTDDGVYDVTPAPLVGATAVAEMVDSPGHRGLIDRGVAHLQGIPHIAVDGDIAVAVNHSVVLLHGPDGFDVWRVAANRWELRRTPEGWKVVRRTNRLLDGDPAAAALLRP